MPIFGLLSGDGIGGDLDYLCPRYCFTNIVQKKGLNSRADRLLFVFVSDLLGHSQIIFWCAIFSNRGLERFAKWVENRAGDGRLIFGDGDFWGS